MKLPEVENIKIDLDEERGKYPLLITFDGELILAVLESGFIQTKAGIFRPDIIDIDDVRPWRKDG